MLCEANIATVVKMNIIYKLSTGYIRMRKHYMNCSFGVVDIFVFSQIFKHVKTKMSNFLSNCFGVKDLQINKKQQGYIMIQEFVYVSMLLSITHALYFHSPFFSLYLSLYFYTLLSLRHSHYTFSSTLPDLFLRLCLV